MRSRPQTPSKNVDLVRRGPQRRTWPDCQRDSRDVPNDESLGSRHEQLLPSFRAGASAAIEEAGMEWVGFPASRDRGERCSNLHCSFLARGGRAERSDGSDRSPCRRRDEAIAKSAGPWPWATARLRRRRQPDRSRVLATEPAPPVYCTKLEADGVFGSALAPGHRAKDAGGGKRFAGEVAEADGQVRRRASMRPPQKCLFGLCSLSKQGEKGGSAPVAKREVSGDSASRNDFKPLPTATEVVTKCDS